MNATSSVSAEISRLTAKKFTRSSWAFRALALTGPRTRSIRFRDVLSAGIHPEFYSDSDGIHPEPLDDPVVAARTSARLGAEASGPDAAPFWRALALTCGYQDLLDTDLADALRFFEVARLLDPEEWRAEDTRLYAQLLWEAGDLDRLAAELPALPVLEEEDALFLAADLAGARHGVGSAAWHEALDVALDRYGLAPVRLHGDGSVPFDRLSAATDRTVDGPLVSVVMSAFRPGPEIFPAVRSILRQTWRNLELFVVDDASGPAYREILDEVAALDPRVRVLVQPVNRGTYAIRNRALAEARGEFVTFQDSDDWSHPERIERQMRPLLDDASVHSSLSRSVRCSSDLTFQYRGQRTSRQNASSLLFRTSVLDRLGGFDTVRKGADTEFILRLQCAVPGTQADLPDQLAFVRLEVDSLSRSDFRPGWHHPSRTEYREGFIEFHRRIARGGSPYVSPDPAERPFPAPRRFVRDTGAPAAPTKFDAVVVADWRGDNPATRAALRRALALAERYDTVGFAHLEAQHRPAAFLLPMSTRLRRHVAAGRLTAVLQDDPIDAGLVLVTEPAVLQYPPAGGTDWSVERVAVVAGTVPGTTYDVDDVVRGARSLFGCEPRWLPESGGVREVLSGQVPDRALAATDVPPVVVGEDWRVNRDRFRGDRPVLGRLGSDDPAHWPADPEVLRAAYPTGDDVDVRIRGGRDRIRRILGEVPPRWLVYRHRDPDVSVRQFLHQLDFFVYFPGEDLAAPPDLVVTRAMAAGCVVVLPERFRAHYGDAAVHCGPAQVREVVTALREDRDAYLEQAARGAAFAERTYPPSTFARYIDTLR